jgi:hypothetical protein
VLCCAVLWCGVTTNRVKRTSRLHLIDLAGSENQNTSAASTQTQFKESTQINLSLTYLSTLLREMAERKPFLNYRNSKLTHLLRDSLGGNTRTCVIANVNASRKYVWCGVVLCVCNIICYVISHTSLFCCHLNSCESVTLSTLKFANNTKAVRNKPTRNEQLSGDVQLQKLQREMLELRKQATAAATAQAQAQAEVSSALWVGVWCRGVVWCGVICVRGL